MITRITERSSQAAQKICKNEKVEKAVSSIAPTVIGKSVELATGNSALGTAASCTTKYIAKSHSKEVAELVTGTAIAVGASVAAPIILPVIAVHEIFKKIF